ncbi:MAG TPA: Hpt domain-containing protein, partial [Polyangiaceae bacterium]
MTARDPELRRLLLLELERHLATLVGDVDSEAVQRAVHALKGSAGLAGEAELAAALQRLERRLKGDDVAARPEVEEVVRVAIQRLGAGESAMLGEWPDPPHGLVMGVPLDAETRAHY